MRFQIGALAAGASVAVAMVVAGPASTSGRSTAASPASAQSSSASVSAWTTRNLKGTVRLVGQVPLRVSAGSVPYLRAHPSRAQITLNFAFPLRDKAGLDRLIAQQARTHQTLSRAELYRRFSPPQAQYDAAATWLRANGFTITHVTADRLSIGARASTATIEKALHVQINDYLRPAFTFQNVKVPAFGFYSNTRPASVPARLGIQTISGLADIDRFFTDYQLSSGGRQAKQVRSGGYFPTDLRGLYDITGHGFDGTGQTLGFTLWTVPERQAAMTTFATDTGDQLITVDPSCTATGNSPTTPSSCSTQTVAADHLMTILENGNSDSNTNFGSNVETALDIEAAHGIATHVGHQVLRVRVRHRPAARLGPRQRGLQRHRRRHGGWRWRTRPTTRRCTASRTAGATAARPSGASPIRSWSPPENSLAIAAAAGTTFYFSTGDAGTYQSGYPTRQPVRRRPSAARARTRRAHPARTARRRRGAAAAAGARTSSRRPSWQTGAGVTANAPCPGRVIPDVSAVADPNTGVRFTASTNLDGRHPERPGRRHEPRGAGDERPAGRDPELRQRPDVLRPDAHDRLRGAASSTSSATAGTADSYYRDVQCGNTANPTSGPDGDAAIKGWDAATGWGEPDWFNFATGLRARSSARRT